MHTVRLNDAVLGMAVGCNESKTFWAIGVLKLVSDIKCFVSVFKENKCATMHLGFLDIWSVGLV